MSDEKLEVDIVESVEYEEIEYVDEYEEVDEDEYNENEERTVAYETWGLNSDVRLAEEAAGWYLLMDLWLDSKDDGRFMQRTHRLAEKFSAYSDMVIGGELRYTLGHVTNPDTLDPNFVSHVRWHMDGQGRSTAWESWSDFRMSKGTSALQMAEEAFQEFGDGNSYGGTKWAYIAHTLLLYETGEISPITFVDMCWGLEHNGGQFFGKLWSTFKLQVALDANVHENMDDLLAIADSNTRKFYEEVK